MLFIWSLIFEQNAVPMLNMCLNIIINPRCEAVKGYCGHAVCPSVTQFTLVLHALQQIVLPHWRSILPRFNFLHMIFSIMLQFCHVCETMVLKAAIFLFCACALERVCGLRTRSLFTDHVCLRT